MGNSQWHFAVLYTPPEPNSELDRGYVFPYLLLTSQLSWLCLIVCFIHIYCLDVGTRMQKVKQTPKKRIQESTPPPNHPWNQNHRHRGGIWCFSKGNVTTAFPRENSPSPSYFSSPSHIPKRTHPQKAHAPLHPVTKNRWSTPWLWAVPCSAELGFSWLESAQNLAAVPLLWPRLTRHQCKLPFSCPVTGLEIENGQAPWSCEKINVF